MAAIDLIVLGMIKQQPQSAYELQKNVEYRNISRWVKISTPSIYKKVIQLEEKGYLEAELVREGNMPEKSVYRITPEGEVFFMTLMEKTARETVSIFLDFNAVIMNLDFMPEEKRKELLEGIHDGISDLKETIEVKGSERQHIPLTGRTILQQQLEMTEAMERWLIGFEKEYLKEYLKKK